MTAVFVEGGGVKESLVRVSSREDEEENWR